MSNSNVIVRIARPTGDNKVANIGSKFYTFNGTIVHVSNDINVDRVGVVPAENIVRKRGTICVADFETSADILEYIEETFQEDKSLSVVYMIVKVDETIDVLYSDPSDPRTWSEGFNFHNVVNVFVEDEMPEEVRSSHPLLRRSAPSYAPSYEVRSEVRTAPTSKPKRDEVQPSRNLVLEVRKRRLAQVEAARKSVEKEVNKPTPTPPTTPTTPIANSKCEITIEEREILLLGGYTPSEVKELKELGRKRVERLLKVLRPQVKDLLETK